MTYSWKKSQSFKKNSESLRKEKNKFKEIHRNFREKANLTLEEPCSIPGNKRPAIEAQCDRAGDTQDIRTWMSTAD